MASPGNPTMPAIPSGGAFGYTSTVDDPLYDPSTHAGTSSSGFVVTNGSYASAGVDVLTTRVSGDSVGRFIVNADGTLEWGGGSGAVDVNLYRAAANVLATDDEIRATAGPVRVSAAALSTSQAFGSRVTADTNDRWSMDAKGKMSWGPGSGASDCDFERSGVGTLRGNGHLTTQNGDVRGREGVAAQTAIGAVGPSSESGIKFGSAGDTNLYRSAADTLKTDDTFDCVKIKFGGADAFNLSSGKIRLLNPFDVQAQDISTDTTTGTKIGTATNQKLGFFNATPVVQQTGIADPTAPGAIYAQAEAASTRNAVVSIITALEALGLLATV